MDSVVKFLKGAENHLASTVPDSPVSSPASPTSSAHSLQTADSDNDTSPISVLVDNHDQCLEPSLLKILKAELVTLDYTPTG